NSPITLNVSSGSHRGSFEHPQEWPNQPQVSPRYPAPVTLAFIISKVGVVTPRQGQSCGPSFRRPHAPRVSNQGYREPKRTTMTARLRNCNPAEDRLHLDRSSIPCVERNAAVAADKNEANRRQQLIQMLMGYWTSRAIYAAAKLQLADRLADGPLSA